MFVHTDDGKLSPRAKKGILVGYPIGVKAYKVWLVDERKCVVSRNVIFQENASYKDLIKRKEAQHEETDDDHIGSHLDLDLEAEEDTISGGERTSNQEPHHTPTPSSAPMSPMQNPDEYDLETDINPTPPSYHLARDRERRETRAPRCFDGEDYFVEAHYTAEDGGEIEPAGYKEAQINARWKDWKLAMDEEMKSQNKNNTWTIVKRPRNQRIIGSRWVYNYKLGTPGVKEARFKARLVAKGYAQREGIDYHEIFAPVVKHVSIRILLTIVVQEDLELEQFDVKTAFLHGELKEKIYMTPPEGYESQFQEDEVCLLNKSLYGLKQSRDNGMRSLITTCLRLVLLEASMTIVHM